VLDRAANLFGPLKAASGALRLGEETTAGLTDRSLELPPLTAPDDLRVERWGHIGHFDGMERLTDVSRPVVLNAVEVNVFTGRPCRGRSKCRDQLRLSQPSRIKVGQSPITAQRWSGDH
jgi:hypothetical protein